MSLAPKKLGLVSATVLTAGTLIGSGVYMLPATLGGVGSISLISWVIASAGALVLACVFGVLSLLRPDADGVVAYAEEALHPALGHVSWFANWLSYWVSGPAVGVAAVGYMSFFFPVLKGQGPALAATLGLIWMFIGASLIGPRLVARIGGGTMMLGLIPLLLTIGVGIFAFQPQVFQASWNVSGKSDGAAIALSVAPVFWALTGMECAVMVSRLIDNPRRNLPLATVSAVGLAALLYIAVSAAILGLMPASALAASSAPFADAIALWAGPLAGGLVALCACAKAIGTLGSLTLITTEIGRAGAESGALPRWMTSARTDPRATRDLLFAGALMSVAAIGTSSSTIGGQFSILINITVMLSVMFYFLCAASLLVIARDLPTLGRRLAARMLAMAGAVFCAGVIAVTDPSLRLPTVGLVAVSLSLWGVREFLRRRRLTG